MENNQRILYWQRYYTAVDKQLASYGLSMDNGSVICDAILQLPTGDYPHKNHSYKSKYYGVCWHKQRGGFIVQVDGKYIGYFKNEINAAMNYDNIVKQLNLDKPLNFGD